MDGAVTELTQSPAETGGDQGAQSIFLLQLREGMSIGCMVTLRGDRSSILRPAGERGAARDAPFAAFRPSRFDGRGNYTLGQGPVAFPEIDYNKVEKTKGMNISITTTARTTPRGSRCCGTWDAVPALGRLAKGNVRVATTAKIAKDAEETEIQDRHGTVLALRAAAGILRQFHFAGICFRQLALSGEVPGVIRRAGRESDDHGPHADMLPAFATRSRRGHPEVDVPASG